MENMTKEEYYEYYYGVEIADPVDLPEGMIDDCPCLEPNDSYWCEHCETYHPNKDANACPEFDKLPF